MDSPHDLAAAHRRTLIGVAERRARAEERLTFHLQQGAIASTIRRQERLVDELRDAEARGRELVERLEAAGQSEAARHA